MKKEITDQMEARMNEIVNEMAAYFGARITAVNLSKWLAVTGTLCVKYPPSRGLTYSPLGFLHDIGWSLLPNLIDCKKEKDRIAVIKRELVLLFECEGCLATKLALSEIGNTYLKDFVKCNYEQAEIYELMNIYTTWLSLISMFSGYEFLKKRLEAKAA